MYLDRGAAPAPRSDAYTTPCGRYGVERSGVARYDVYGPAGFIDWFVRLEDARECAEVEAGREPEKKQPRRCR